MAVFDGLGTALRLLRVERGLTQVQVAELSGIGKSLISRYEAEVTEPKLESLGRFLESLGSDLRELEEALQRVQRHQAFARATTDVEEDGPAERTPEPHRTYVVFEMRDDSPPVAEASSPDPETVQESFRSMMRFLMREIPRTREAYAPSTREEKSAG